MRNPFIPDLPSIFLMQSQTKTLRIPNISTTDHYFTHDVHVTYIYIYSNRLALRILIIYVPAVYYIYMWTYPSLSHVFVVTHQIFPGGAWGRPRLRPLVAAGFARHRGGVPAINMVISGKVYYIVLAGNSWWFTGIYWWLTGDLCIVGWIWWDFV